MPYIMNSLEDEVKTQAHGKYFTWKPKEIKTIHSVNLSRFLAQNRGDIGLMEVPDALMELDKNSVEFKTAIADIRKEGIRKFIQKQNYIVRNLEMSLRRDYELSGQKGNFLFEASPGELAAYKNLKKYQEVEAQESMNVADEIQKIRKDLYGETSRPSPLESEAPAQPLTRK